MKASLWQFCCATSGYRAGSDVQCELFSSSEDLSIADFIMPRQCGARSGPYEVNLVSVGIRWSRGC